LGRYSKTGSDSDPSLKWIGLWVVWLVIFLGVLPTVMQCTDAVCSGIDPNSLLILWFDITTLFGIVSYLQFVFGIWALLVIIGALDMMN
jgi:hypothetical protein